MVVIGSTCTHSCAIHGTQTTIYAKTDEMVHVDELFLMIAFKLGSWVTTHCDMQALLEAQGISTAVVQEKMVTAKCAWEESQKQRACLVLLTCRRTGLEALRSGASGVEKNERNGMGDKKHATSYGVEPNTPMSSGLTWPNQALYDLRIMAVHGSLCNLASAQIAEKPVSQRPCGLRCCPQPFLRDWAICGCSNHRKYLQRDTTDNTPCMGV